MRKHPSPTLDLTNDEGAPVGKQLSLGREADRVDRLGERDRAVEGEDGDVVLKGLGVIVLVHLHGGQTVVARACLALLVEVVLAEADGDVALLEP